MSRLDVFRSSPLFADCTEQELAKLDRMASEREFGAEEFVFAQGSVAQELIVVAAGEIQLELPVSILGESKSIAFEAKTRGEVVGWSALVPPHRYTLTARASREARVVVLPAAELTALFHAEPELGFRMMKNFAAIVAERLQHMQSMWLQEIQRNLDERYR
jgi:CRP-like cAMP-binding protein